MAEINTEGNNHEAISVETLPDTNSTTLDPARLTLSSSSQSLGSHYRKIREIVNRIQKEKVCLGQQQRKWADNRYLISGSTNPVNWVVRLGELSSPLHGDRERDEESEVNGKVLSYPLPREEELGG
jgi:hypothetical protein